MTEGHRAAVDKHAAPQGGVATDDPRSCAFPPSMPRSLKPTFEPMISKTPGRLVGCDNVEVGRADDQQGLRGAGLMT